MRYRALKVVVVGTLACALAVAAGAEEDDHRSVEAVNILGLVVPTYPAEQERAGVDGVVAVRFRVTDDGRVRDLTLTSAPSPFDAAVREALPAWFVEPPICYGETREPEVRLRVAFTHEGERRFVTIRDPELYVRRASTADGAATDGAAGSAPARTRQTPKRISGPEPKYPSPKINRGLRNGTVLAVVEVAPDGSAHVTRMFGRPRGHFEDAVREALDDWKFEPRLDAAGRPERWTGCVTVNFSYP